MVSFYFALQRETWVYELISAPMTSLHIHVYGDKINWNYSKYILYEIYEVFLLFCSTWKYSSPFPHKIYNKVHAADRCLYWNSNMFLMPTANITEGCQMCAVCFIIIRYYKANKKTLQIKTVFVIPYFWNSTNIHIKGYAKFPHNAAGLNVILVHF